MHLIPLMYFYCDFFHLLVSAGNPAFFRVTFFFKKTAWTNMPDYSTVLKFTWLLV